jgi:hypothetical protein
VQGPHNYICSVCAKEHDLNEAIGCARYISLGSRADPNFKPDGHVDLCERCM